jgi:hypothetical protein
MTLKSKQSIISGDVGDFFLGPLLISVDTFVLLSRSLDDLFVTEPKNNRGGFWRAEWGVKSAGILLRARKGHR